MRHTNKPIFAALLSLGLAACGGGGGGSSTALTTNHTTTAPSTSQVLFASQYQTGAQVSVPANAAIYAAGSNTLQRLGTIVFGGTSTTTLFSDPLQQYAYFQSQPSGTTGGATPTGVYDLASGTQSQQTVSDPFIGGATDGTGVEYMYSGFPGQPGLQAYRVGAQGVLTAADNFTATGVALPTGFSAVAKNLVVVAGEDAAAQNIEIGLYTLGTDPATQQNGYLSLVGTAQAAAPTASTGSTLTMPLLYALPNWNSAYVETSTNPNELEGFALSATTGVGAVQTNTVSGPVAGIAESATANYIYTRSLSSGNAGCTINGYTTSPTGVLSPVNNGTPLFSQPSAETCVVQTNGLTQSPAVIVSALMVSQTGSVQTMLYTFAINADGTWTSTGIYTAPSPAQTSSPFGFVDEVNQRLFTITPSGIYGWSLAANGALTPIQNGGPLATPDSGMSYSSSSILPNATAASLALN